MHEVFRSSLLYVVNCFCWVHLVVSREYLCTHGPLSPSYSQCLQITRCLHKVQAHVPVVLAQETTSATNPDTPTSSRRRAPRRLRAALSSRRGRYPYQVYSRRAGKRKARRARRQLFFLEGGGEITGKECGIIMRPFSCL